MREIKTELMDFSQTSDYEEELNLKSSQAPIKKFTLSKDYFDKENQDANAIAGSLLFPKSSKVSKLNFSDDEELGELKFDSFKIRELQRLIGGMQTSRSFSKDSTVLDQLRSLKIKAPIAFVESCEQAEALNEDSCRPLTQQTYSQSQKIRETSEVPVLTVQMRKQNFRNIKGRLKELSKSSKALSSTSQLKF